MIVLDKGARQKQILQIIAQRGSIGVNELIAQFPKTPATIRKDLSSLEQDGYIKRTRGVAHIVKENSLLPSQTREDLHKSEKRVIAELAAKEVQPGDVVILDSGSTVHALSLVIGDIPNLTVITNSVPIAQTFGGKSSTLIVCGGIRQPIQMATVGPETERYLSNIEVDKAFIGATGVRGFVGLTAISPLQCTVKQLMIKAAKKVYALLDSSKFNTISLNVFAGFEDIDYIITDKPIQNEELAQVLTEKNVTVICPDSSAES